MDRELLLRAPIQFRKSVGHKLTIYSPANLKIEKKWMGGFLDICDLTKLKLNKINNFSRSMASREIELKK